MKLWIPLAAGFALFFCKISGALAISFEEVERIDKQEQSELLERAKQAARAWNFGAAQNYLNQARNKGYAPKDIKAVETLIAQNQSAKAADDERKRREEAERVARQSAPSGGGGTQNFVIVTAECVGGFGGCTAKNLSISGGPGNFNSHFSGANSGGIHRGYSGALAGQYRYSVHIDNRVCSGSFSISGQNSGVTLSLYKDCNVSYIKEY